jgi:hypothetical protein
MMNVGETLSHLHLEAAVVEVLPQFGLAYVADRDDRTWAVTRATQGSGLDTLHAGQRLLLDVETHPSFSIVRRYEALN